MENVASSKNRDSFQLFSSFPLEFVSPFSFLHTNCPSASIRQETLSDTSSHSVGQSLEGGGPKAPAVGLQLDSMLPEDSPSFSAPEVVVAKVRFLQLPTYGVGTWVARDVAGTIEGSNFQHRQHQLSLPCGRWIYYSSPAFPTKSRRQFSVSCPANRDRGRMSLLAVSCATYCA